MSMEPGMLETDWLGKLLDMDEVSYRTRHARPAWPLVSRRRLEISRVRRICAALMNG